MECSSNRGGTKMTQKTKVCVITEKDEFQLVKKINEFGLVKEVFATQTHKTEKGWTAFLYFKNGGEE